MTGFYGKTYRYDRSKVIGVYNILCGKLFVLATYDLKTKEWTKYKPLCKGAKELQTKLDEYAHEVGLPEVL